MIKSLAAATLAVGGIVAVEALSPSRGVAQISQGNLSPSRHSGFSTDSRGVSYLNGLGPIVITVLDGSGGANGWRGGGDVIFGYQGPNLTPGSGFAGLEDTFVGVRAGGAFTGASNYNTAVGHSACGPFGAAHYVGVANVCVGNDAGRNIYNTNYATIVGWQAGRNLTGSLSPTLIGSQAGTAITNGKNDVLIGANAGSKITTGSGNIVIGSNAASTTLTTGSSNILIGNGFGIDTPSHSANNYLDIGGAIVSANYPSLPVQIVNGVQLPVSTVAALPTCNRGLAGTMRAVSDASGPSYNGSLTGGGTVKIPVFCNGSAWTAH